MCNHNWQSTSYANETCTNCFQTRGKSNAPDSRKEQSMFNDMQQRVINRLIDGWSKHQIVDGTKENDALFFWYANAHAKYVQILESPEN